MFARLLFLPKFLYFRKSVVKKLGVSMFVLLVVIGSKVFSGFVNDILSCLHFDLLNRKPSARDFVKNQSTRDCIDLVPFFSTHSARMVSFTYFQMFVFVTLRSIIFVRNNQGPCE